MTTEKIKEVLEDIHSKIFIPSRGITVDDSMIFYSVLEKICLEEPENIKDDLHIDLTKKETYTSGAYDLYLTISDMLIDSMNAKSVTYRMLRGLVNSSKNYEEEFIVGVLSSALTLGLSTDPLPSMDMSFKEMMNRMPEAEWDGRIKYNSVRRRDLQSQEEKELKLAKAEEKRMNKLNKKRVLDGRAISK